MRELPQRPDSDAVAVIEAYVDGAGSPDASDANGMAGHMVAAAMLDIVGPLFRGRSLAIALGSGAGSVLLGLASQFDRVRGVDASPSVLATLRERAARAGVSNVEGFLIDKPWDEPTGLADYVYALDLFRRVQDKVEAANDLQRISMALHRGGIAHLRFDTRLMDTAYRVRQRLPGPLASSADGDGTRSVRRLESWVRDRVRGADLEILGERGAGTASHWVVARRR